MDRETEASDALNKQELLKNADNTAERRRKKSECASIETYGSFALKANTYFTALTEIFLLHSPLRFKNC